MPQQLASRPNINTHERKCENYEILSCKTSDHRRLQFNAEPNRHWEIKSNVTEDHLQNICLTAKYPWWPQIANLRCMYPKGWISGAFGAVQKPSTVTFYPGGWGNHFCQFRILRRWWNVGELETGGGGGIAFRDWQCSSWKWIWCIELLLMESPYAIGWHKLHNLRLRNRCSFYCIYKPDSER